MHHIVQINYRRPDIAKAAWEARYTDDRATLGFTARGIESLKELSLDQKR